MSFFSTDALNLTPQRGAAEGTSNTPKRYTFQNPIVSGGRETRNPGRTKKTRGRSAFALATKALRQKETPARLPHFHFPKILSNLLCIFVP
jgi:hypothetical protein